MSDALFDTARLQVRRLRRSDADGMLAVYGDEDAMRWVGDGRAITTDAVKQWLDVTERNVATRGYGMCALLLRGHHEVIGFCGLVHPGGQAEAEIKYALARSHWGRGYATEAVHAMLDWGARTFGLRHVIATTAPENNASHAVLRKAGLRDGELRRNADGSSTQVFDWRATAHRVFVYGTLKDGFRNFHVNRGVRVPGTFVTEQAYPLYVIGEFGLPWLVHEPGQGHHVTGQVFEVDDPSLAAMDVLERINEAGWYTRILLTVRQTATGHLMQALAYFGSPARLLPDSIHCGPIAEYTEALQAIYKKHL